MKESWECKTIEELSIVACDGDWIESKDQSPQGIRLVQTGKYW
jgi:type I restriction enzyme S subunit